MEEGTAILREWKKFMLHQSAFYHSHTLVRELEKAIHFVVPTAHRVVAMNRCHRQVEHQGQRQTMSLLQEKFWLPGKECGFRWGLVAERGVFDMRVPESGLHYKLFWSPLLWDCFM